MTAPLVFRWDGEALIPRNPKVCDERLVVGEVYRCDVIEERSLASHSHFFATLHDHWMSLPDNLAVQFPSVEILRKHALIMKGWRRERKFAMSSKEEARRLAAFLRPQSADDDYAIISVHGTAVVEWKALSQSYKAMPRKGDFQKSKQDVLDFVSDLLGLTDTEAAA